MPAHRKPVELHRLAGTFRADRHASRAAVTPAPGIAEPPAWLCTESTGEFRRLAAALNVSPTYSVALALLADAILDYRKTAEAAAASPLTIEGPDGTPKAHPAHRQKSQAWARLVSACKEFGITPASAERVTVSTPAPAAPLTVADFRLTK